MNSMSDSGDFKMWNRIVVELSHVPFKLMIPSSRSFLSRDKRLPLDTRNTSGLQENVFFEIIFLRLNHPQIILKEFKPTMCKETLKQALMPEGRRLFTQVKTQNQGIISMLHTMLVEFPRGKFDSKTKSLLVLIFHRMLCCGSKKWRWLIL